MTGDISTSLSYESRQTENGRPKGPIVLVTGGTGLVGSAIRELIEAVPEGSRFGRLRDEEWVFTSSKEYDLRDIQACRAMFERYRPTHVIHLAARVGGLFANMSGNSDFLRDNLLMNDSVLQTAHEYKVEKVVSCLSTCVFPDQVEYPLTEEKVHLGPPHPSNFGYSHAKRLVDVMNRAYYEQYGDMFTSVIPTNVFGPHDNFDLRTAHVIPALIHRCFLAKRTGSEFVVGGTGRPLRQFIYSKDLAKLFVCVLREYDEIDPLILSVDEDEEISIKDVADTIVKTVGFEGPYEFDATKADGQYRKPASNAKLRRLLGKSPKQAEEEFTFTPFDTAMRETVGWFAEHYSVDARIGDRSLLSS
ncbi:GDP-L-fucose synthetase [Naematelia encephala]|uniref:GDP-L-fucose synthase n=1 Tax=Naematelia encephala TaxID=71784 RepID=A0A1Y2ASI5_9TREE|nr:GDP-L-fucose synthetase [Naematelia encephala]